MFRGLSRARKVLRVVGITFFIIGGILMIYWIPQPRDEYVYMIGDEEYYGSSRFVQVGGIFFGLVSIFVGYRAVKYIPKAEREKYDLLEDRV